VLSAAASANGMPPTNASRPAMSRASGFFVTVNLLFHG
jgi:hypothetical protein